MMIASKDVEVDDRVKAVMEAEFSEKNEEDPSQKGEHDVFMTNHERSHRCLGRTLLLRSST